MVAGGAGSIEPRRPPTATAQPGHNRSTTGSLHAGDGHPAIRGEFADPATREDFVTSEPLRESPSTGGWYVDPYHPGRLRYFDGREWTVETRERPGYQPAHGGPPTNRSPSARGLTKGIAIVFATLSGLLTLGAFLSADVYAGVALLILAIVLAAIGGLAITLIRLFVWVRRGPPIGAWWLAILLTGCLGGLAGYVALRPTEPQRARVVLRVAILWTVFALLSWFLVRMIFFSEPVQYD
jgi:Protein of unknown function (DUF2510)